jgi:hypothetical protein
MDIKYPPLKPVNNKNTLHKIVHTHILKNFIINFLMIKRLTIKNTDIAMAWSKVHHRTEWLAELLKLKLIKFEERPPYLRSFKNTIKLLTNSRNDMVLIQGTHGPLALLSTSFQNTSRYISLIDLHSGFIIPSSWKSFILTLPFRNTLNKFDIIITFLSLK